MRIAAVRTAAVNARRPGGVVDHRRDAAGRVQPEQRKHHAVGIGQQHADRLAGRLTASKRRPSTRAPVSSLAVAQRAGDDVLDDRSGWPESAGGVAHGRKQAAVEPGSGKPCLGSRSNSALLAVATEFPPDRSTSSAIVIGSSAVIVSFGNQRRGACLARRQRERQVACAADEDRHDLRVGLGRDARHGAEEAEGFGVGLDLVGQIDGEPALALEQAHQPPADEDMLGVEGDGAGKLAPRLEPCRLRRCLVEYVQRLFGQQRQHQRRVERATGAR